MTEPSSPKDDRNSAISFDWREVEFDVAADLGIGATVPVGEFTRCEDLHLLAEFDCSQSPLTGDDLGSLRSDTGGRTINESAAMRLPEPADGGVSPSEQV